MLKSEAKLEKRKKIEAEMRRIVLSDSREILKRNLSLRKRPRFSAGDRIRLVELLGNHEVKERENAMYRISEGTVLQVTGGGYFVEGVTQTGVPTKDFINMSHVINGVVRLSEY